ncbi:MAG: hypothetical protein K2P65_15750 [Lachnospiraceae bacterium]|nr:hypothetical protein [Lachnospiraceae bacterium]
MDLGDLGNYKKGAVVLEQLEKRLLAYAKANVIRPDESMIEETLVNAKRSFYEGVAGRKNSYFEFFYEQVRFIEKKWWVLQFLILFFLGWILQQERGAKEIQRILAVCASLFVIMAVPELWKNRSSHSVEIEEASYFSLRQIYAARMLAFAMTDSLLLGAFTAIVSMTTAVSVAEIVIHFFLPMTVTCCICFRTLCGRFAGTEYMACFFSLLWSAVWTLLILNKDIYLTVSVPAWMGILCMAVLYLTYTVRKVIGEYAHETEIFRL